MPNSALVMMALVNDGQFRQRFTGLLIQMAAQILNTTIGQGTPPVTSGQQTYARAIVQNPGQYVSSLIQYEVFRTNLIDSTVTVSVATGAPVVTTDATDAAMLSQLATDWPSLSGA